jgi:uncharacterized protein YpmS
MLFISELNQPKQISEGKNSLKLKIFGILILTILVLPIIISSTGEGAVLGASESESQILNQSTINSISVFENTSTNTQPSSISSGVAETISEDTTDQEKLLTGKVIFSDEQKIPVISNKIPLGKEFKVTSKNSKLDLVVNETKAIEQEAILSVSKPLFIELGGNPSLEKSIFVEVELD